MHDASLGIFSHTNTTYGNSSIMPTTYETTSAFMRRRNWDRRRRNRTIGVSENIIKRSDCLIMIAVELCEYKQSIYLINYDLPFILLL